MKPRFRILRHGRALGVIRRFHSPWLALWWLAVLPGSPAFGDPGRAVHDPEDRPHIPLPRQALAAEALAVVVNDLDPTSRRIADYYGAKRGIPAANLIHVRFTPGRRVMDVQLFRAIYELERIDADYIAKKSDVLFYFTGLAKVPEIDTNRFRPGAVADHLTSSGGRLTSRRQMSSLRWLEAGATGSYGSVVEPSNLLPKFPNPGLVIAAYVSGATLIEVRAPQSRLT